MMTIYFIIICNKIYSIADLALSWLWKDTVDRQELFIHQTYETINSLEIRNNLSYKIVSYGRWLYYL